MDISGNDSIRAFIRIITGLLAIVLMAAGICEIWHFISTGGNPYASYTEDITAEMADIKGVTENNGSGSVRKYLSVFTYSVNGKEYMVPAESAEKFKAGDTKELIYDPADPANAVDAALRQRGGAAVLTMGTVSMLTAAFFAAVSILAAGRSRENN